MSFGAPSMPAPVVMPPPPIMATPLTPATTKPPRKASAPTFIGGDLFAQGGQQGQRTLIGGAPTALGAA
jgi:hypothetical protein